MNLPNKLTVLRLIMIPIFVIIFFMSFTGHYIVSAIVFALAAFTDFLDGYIARKENLVTDLGKFLDPIADKVLVATAFIVMLVSSSGEAIIPWYGAIAVAVILARELIISGFRMIAANKGIVLAADKSGKIKTTVQDVAIIVLLIGGGYGRYGVLNVIGLVLLGIATVLTIYSGIECFVKNKSVIASK